MVLVDLTQQEIQLLDVIFKKMELPLDAAEVALGRRKKVYTAFKSELDEKLLTEAKKKEKAKED